MRRQTLLAACVLLPALTVPPAAVAQPQRETAVLQKIGIDQRLNEPLPLDAVFRDDAGREVRLGDYLGTKPIILALVYYECPMLCTLTLNGLTSTLKELTFTPGQEFDVVTVSIDPRESPELAAAKKKNYVERYGRAGTEKGWHFLTGQQDAIDRVARAVGFRYQYVPEKKIYAHAAGIMIVTPQGRLARYFYGVEFVPRDVRLGLVEASQNRIGSAVDHVLLYCYQYDPTTGKYTAAAMNIVRLAGALTVLVLGSVLFLTWRRERKRVGTIGRGVE